MKLHELHRRRLEATVRLFEDALARIERLVLQRGKTGIVRSVEDTLSEEERGALLDQVHQLQKTLHEFAREFSLESMPMDIRQVLNAELASAWVMLENCRPKRMKGYGQAFEERTKKVLEERIEQLLEQVSALRASLA